MKPQLAKCLSVALMACASALAQSPAPVQIASGMSATSLSSPPSPAPAQGPGNPLANTGAPAKHRIGPLEISINWRTRTEGWSWFQGDTGNSDYGFWNSTLRLGIGQTGEHFDWFVEGEQPSILALPDNAVIAAPQGQLGLGGTYYAANNNHSNTASGFVKQAFVSLKHLGSASLKIGRMEYFDGAEIKPGDPMLATVVQTRLSHRLISNFGFSAVQRAFDGGQLSLTAGANNLTFFAARPTQGVFQVKGMDELEIDIYSGTYTHLISKGKSAGELRLFGIGYIDHRGSVLKTDNRPQMLRAGDHHQIAIATYGGNYAHVYNSEHAGKFDALFWGALQTGSWGTLSQHAAAFVGEAGWQLPVKLQPWLSTGYSYGSGDGNANDSRHGSFFQLLPTPRPYARFPFYNMMNNEDVYGTLTLHLAKRLSLRTEAHAIRLASAKDLWYSGGGAFQPKTFGYTGRPSSGNRGLGNVWDANADYQFTPSFGASLYYGHAWGKGVVDAIYPRQTNGQFVFLETNYHF